MTEADLYAFLVKSRFGLLETAGPDGIAQSELTGIAVTPQPEIVFDTVRSSRKYANLTARSACSFVFGGWGPGQQRVEYRGEAQVLAPDDMERYEVVYCQAWPDGTARMGWPGIVYFVVRPKWIRYSDFDRSPAVIGEIREFTFRDGRGES